MNTCPWMRTVENDLRKIELGDPFVTLLIPGKEYEYRCRLCYDTYRETGGDPNCEIYESYKEEMKCRDFSKADS